MADATEPLPMTAQEAEEAAQEAEEYLHNVYGSALSVWDRAWRVLLNPGHLKPEFSVDDRTDALVSLEIDRKEDLELLVNGAAFASGEAHTAALVVLYRLFGTDQLILLQEALQQSAEAAEQLAVQVPIPAPGGAGRHAKRHHYRLPVVSDGYLKRADGEIIEAFRRVEHPDPYGKLNATLRAQVPAGVDPADPSTWLCPATPCCDGRAHLCGCGRRHYRHKQNMMVEAAAQVPNLHHEAAERRARYRESRKDLLVVEYLSLVKTTRARPIAQTADEQQEELQARSRSKLTDVNRRNMLHSDVQREQEFANSWTTSFEALDGLCPGEAVHSGEWVVHFCTTCQAEDAGEEYRSL
ncbi:hypothetical protein B484DRAFT_477388, partial [Ochromonadaceae sp. CCMP2298]